MTNLSIIIITWNSEQYITQCFDSVLRCVEDISHELIVIDNGSTDNTRKLLSTYEILDSVNIKYLTQNLGVAKARNIGLREVTGKYIWILDIDTIVNKEAILSMIKFLNETPKCGICACRLTYMDGSTQKSCRKLPTLKYKIYNLVESIFDNVLTMRLYKFFHKKNQTQFYTKQIEDGIPFEAEYVIGANQLIRKEALDAVGLLDEKIFYGPEDADFCLRTKQKDWSIYFLPQVSIIHEYRRITNKKIFSAMTFKHINALLYYFVKHR